MPNPPSHLDPEAWAAFVEMRRKIKAPLTDYACKLIWRDLERIRQAGHDPNASLDQSTMHGWRGVFQPREIEVTHASRSEADKTRAYLEEQRANLEASKATRREPIRLRGA